MSRLTNLTKDAPCALVGEPPTGTDSNRIGPGGWVQTTLTTHLFQSCPQYSQRFGAIGKHGSIAVIERLIRTLKDGLRRLGIPLCLATMRGQLHSIIGWHNEHRPHTTLNGRTPIEVYLLRFPADWKLRTTKSSETRSAFGGNTENSSLTTK